MPSFISKTKYLNGLQCDKLLWYLYNDKASMPSISDDTQAIFAQGHDVGKLAQQLYPDAIDLQEEPFDFSKSLKTSLEALAHRKPLFEAAFKHNNTYARADILVPVDGDRWDIVEVKSSTSVKDVNIDDLSVQRYVYEGAGLTINRCFLIYINNEYVRDGDIDPTGLFTKEDITEEVKARMPQVLDKLDHMHKVIQAGEVPNIRIGAHCDNPYSCVMKSVCWSHVPEHNVTTLYWDSDKGMELLDRDILNLTDIPEDISLNEKQEIQVNAVRNNETHFNLEGIREELDKLVYPLYYLDFETVNPAVPFFNNSSPYQQVPFQFSLHIQETEGAEPTHFDYLLKGDKDPRPEILAELKQLLGDNGSIVAYNAGFEMGCIRSSVKAYPDYKEWFQELEPRFYDLLVPFRAFHYYHPDQYGSASLKAIQPILVPELDYKELNIGEGGTASTIFKAILAGNLNGDEEKIRKDLLDYCERDTLVMVKLVEVMRGMVGG